MNEPAPKTSLLQIAIIVAAMLATILAVTTYRLYRENLKLKQQLEQRNTHAAAPSRRLDDDVSRNPCAFLLVSRSERYNRI